MLRDTIKPPATPAAGAKTLRLRVTSDPANLAPVRKACERFCLEHGLSAAAANDVGLCVNDAMANVTRHAYDGAYDRPVEVTGEPEPGDAGGVRIAIRDWGKGINPADVTRVEHGPDNPGGLGLICLRRLLDEVRYEPQPDGMLMTMVKRKEPTAKLEESDKTGGGCC